MTTNTARRPAPVPPRRPQQRRPGAVAGTRRAADRRRTLHLIALLAGVGIIVGVITAMMLSSRPTSSTVVRSAPAFTLTTTAGTQVNLADYRGRTVVLYFSEGAGCGSCLTQMGAIEQDAAFAKAGIVVLPIVMNSRSAIMRDMQTYGVRTPFLLDDGTVSRAYDTLGRGMHADLPGHSFVLIDSTGTQRWYGEYPSMWLSPQDLLDQARKHLSA